MEKKYSYEELLDRLDNFALITRMSILLLVISILFNIGQSCINSRQDFKKHRFEVNMTHLKDILCNKKGLKNDDDEELLKYIKEGDVKKCDIENENSKNIEENFFGHTKLNKESIKMFIVANWTKFPYYIKKTIRNKADYNEQEELLETLKKIDNIESEQNKLNELKKQAGME